MQVEAVSSTRCTSSPKHVTAIVQKEGAYLMADSQQALAGTGTTLAYTTRPRGLVLVAVIMFLAALITVAYWVIWFGGGRALLASSQAASYFVFENAFPAADAWLVVTLLFGAIGILRRRSWGFLSALLAGGAGIYLGCMDVLFDLENNIYSFARGADPSAVVTEMVINFLTFVLSITILSYIWRHRTWLLEAN